MFLGTDFIISILEISISISYLGSTKSLHGDIRSSWLTETFCKMSDSCYWTPPSPKPYILTFPHCRFGAVSQSWDAASQAAVLILPQVKLNSQLSNCTSFLVDSYGDWWSDPVDFLPSTGLHKELELWYKQQPLVPICLLRECRRI